MEKARFNMQNHRSCPICLGASNNSELFLEENIKKELISDLSFASRKPPEFMSHLLMRCLSCGLVYASNPPSVEDLSSAYHQASYDSSEEAKDAAQSYLKSTLPVLKRIPVLDSALEIGTGSGIYLDLLHESGFKNLVGIEPSIAAINSASPKAREWIRHEIFEEKNFEPESFDLICCFMTLEHVQDPMEITLAAHKLLRKGGAFVTVTHDYEGLLNRLLGKRSPIIDIEHMQLFSKQSIKQLFSNGGFHSIQSNSFQNRYAVSYWLRLLPLSNSIKDTFNKFLALLGLSRIKLAANVGNTFTVGFK